MTGPTDAGDAERGPSPAGAPGSPNRSDRHPSELEAVVAGRARRRRQWTLLASVLAGVSLVAAFGSFGLTHDPEEVRSALISKPAPNFSLPSLGGVGTVRLSDFRGDVVVVNFWASWCRPCEVEHPAFLAAWRRFRDQGVVFVGVLYQDTSARGRAFRAKNGGDWPVASDPEGRAALAYGVFGVPETFFIGADGRIAFKQVGATSYGVLTGQITKLLKARSG